MKQPQDEGRNNRKAERKQTREGNMKCENRSKKKYKIPC